jgi:prepilin-type N-terminal cleavage/methylation domain-containing protein
VQGKHLNTTQKATATGFTLIEILVVLVVIGLIAGVALPRLYGIAHRFELEAQRDQLLADLGNLGYKAYLSGQALRLTSLPGSAGSDSSPITMPPGWRVDVTSPITYTFAGICSGGNVTLRSPDGPSLQYSLAAPVCQPHLAETGQPHQP